MDAFTQIGPDGEPVDVSGELPDGRPNENLAPEYADEQYDTGGYDPGLEYEDADDDYLEPEQLEQIVAQRVEEELQPYREAQYHSDVDQLVADHPQLADERHAERVVAIAHELAGQYPGLDPDDPGVWRSIVESGVGTSDPFTEQVVRATQGHGSEALPFDAGTGPQGAGVIDDQASFVKNVIAPGKGSSALPFS